MSRWLHDATLVRNVHEKLSRYPAVGIDNEKTRVDWLRRSLQMIPAGSRILDAGAGELKFKHLCTHLDYVSQDFGGYDGQGDEVGLQMKTWDNSKVDIISDISNIPEPNESFDAIMCVEVFEHIPDPVLAIKEFARLLKSGGQLIVTAPFCSLTHFAPYHFSTGFSRYYYEAHLEKHGFRIVEMMTNGNYFEYLAQEVRRISTVSKRYVGRRPGVFEWVAMGIVLQMLRRFSRADEGSSELLNFGYGVLAVKK